LAVLVTVEGTPSAFDAGLAIGLPTDGTRLAPLQPPLFIFVVLVAKVAVEGYSRGRGGGWREDMVGVWRVGATAANGSHHERASGGC